MREHRVLKGTLCAPFRKPYSLQKKIRSLPRDHRESLLTAFSSREKGQSKPLGALNSICLPLSLKPLPRSFANKTQFLNPSCYFLIDFLFFDAMVWALNSKWRCRRWVSRRRKRGGFLLKLTALVGTKKLLVMVVAFILATVLLASCGGGGGGGTTAGGTTQKAGGTTMGGAKTITKTTPTEKATTIQRTTQ